MYPKVMSGKGHPGLVRQAVLQGAAACPSRRRGCRANEAKLPRSRGTTGGKATFHFEESTGIMVFMQVSMVSIL